MPSYKQPNQSDHTDYEIMLARTKAAKRGATPVEIQMAPEWIEEARAISAEQWRDLDPKPCTYWSLFIEAISAFIASDPIELEKEIHDLDDESKNECK